MREKKSPDLICRFRSSLLLVDIQEKLLPVIHGGQKILSQASRLLIASELFEIPLTVSEQYPQGLGSTVSDLNVSQHSNLEVIEKATFSCREKMDRFQKLKDEGRDQIVVCGIESHICVLQTCLDLSAFGFQVFLVTDAIGSRDSLNTDWSIQRCLGAGVVPVPTESVLFEWCEDSKDKNFKSISQLVR